MDWTEIGRACLEIAIPIIGTVLSTLLVALVGIAVVYMRRKWGIDISQKDEDAIKEAVLDGIAYAEEQAMKAEKGGTGRKLPSDEKRDIAVDYASQDIARKGVEPVGEVALARMAEALIEDVRP